ncbi:glycoside hydrolase family 16 protein [Planomonospora corallina]|uniref:Glycoside hydrolase family 16 protein n=1 Tax=Planomonospora corallina TaxID=1806052 RepID=A0ABV8I1N6_9ACTN
MILRFHARTAVLSMVTTLALGALGAAPAQAAARGCPSAPDAKSAARVHGWGAPAWCDEFEDQYLDSARWLFYDTPGHAGKGRRTSQELYLGNGSLYLHGLPDGTTAGLGARHSQSYGRWETRIRLYRGAGAYRPMALLWPDGGGGGEYSATREEIDFMGVYNDPNRQRADFFLETPKGGHELGYADVDMTKWHTYAVENTPAGVVGYLDGREWFRSSHSTRSPMSLCLQLDWFPGEGSDGEAWMEVDWVRIYPMRPGD